MSENSYERLLGRLALPIQARDIAISAKITAFEDLSVDGGDNKF